jgi:hypothetical protein
LPIKLFGRSRLPSAGQPGLSIFDLQARIGHSSPEVHAFFPKQLSVRRALESAWAEAPLSKPRLTYEIDEIVSAALRWFQAELCPDLGPTPLQKDEIVRVSRWDRDMDRRGKTVEDFHRSDSRITGLAKAYQETASDPTALSWADERSFGSLSFSAQRVILFLRAMIKGPDLIILDEAFSGMDASAKDKCRLFLSRGETAILRYRKTSGLLTLLGPRPQRSDLDRLNLVRIRGLQEHQALVVIAHRSDEVPGSVRDWICLPEPGENEPPRVGKLDSPLELDVNGWRRIWDQRLLFRDINPLEQISPEEQRERNKLYKRRWRAKRSPDAREKGP